MAPLAEALRGDSRLAHDIYDAYWLIEDVQGDLPEWLLTIVTEGSE